MVAAVAVAVAVGAIAAAASDAGAGEKSSLTTSADDTAVGSTTLQLDASDAANALLIMDGANTDTINLPGHYTINAAGSQGRGDKVAYDPPMSAAGEQASAQSTSAENGFIVSNPFPFTETASANKDHSAFQFKPSMDHHAVTDPEINDIANHSDNFKFADDDGSAHPGHATGKDASVQSTPADNGHHAIADPEISLASIAPNHPPGHPADNSLHMPAQLDGNGVLTVT